MAIYRRGNKGSGVKELQSALKDAGYDVGPIDGIFGPLTEAAVRAYETDKGWKPDGVVGRRILKSLGINSSTPGDNPEDYTDDENTRFNGLPGQPEIWYNTETDTWSVVYFAPGTEPPVPLLFTVSSTDDLESFFGDKKPVADRKLTTAEITQTGSILFGSTNTIPEKEGDVWAGFLERMERAKKTQPWLEDPEVFGIFAGAWLEGRSPERWELEGTEWWQTHNEAQREWMWLVNRDPEQANEVFEQNYITIFNEMKALGFTDVPDEVLDYMATKFSQGNWNQGYLQMQTLALAGQETPEGLDRGLKRFMKKNELDLARPNNMEEQVRNLFNTWLGPAHPPSDKQVQEWAAKFRDNPDEAATDLTGKLRSQRKALFPEYEDDSLTYDDIASPWRGVMASAWGETPDETDPVFNQLIKLNDSVEAGKLLRKEGIARGNQQVEREMLMSLYSTVGGPRNPV